jgi:secondary thiamine-phosphate synthase enzyme
MEMLLVATQQHREVRDITDKLRHYVPEHGSGILTLFLQHTTAAITVADLDPGTDQDFLDAWQLMMPANTGQGAHEKQPELSYRHPHNPDHTPDHILSATIGVSEIVPFADGELLLGTWQHIILCEFDGPRDRSILVNVCSS